ncbi:unnamed protein product [Thelazia callipaeda]|uniref:Nucleosome-remodeling factor subunit NURF301 n=1 Tax=Thelazia callipaeda TaxID=103827 RepID=A0A0N5D3N7_THECL|nr:unnamed protein product [Thelazia callipaeda]
MSTGQTDVTYRSGMGNREMPRAKSRGSNRTKLGKVASSARRSNFKQKRTRASSKRLKSRAAKSKDSRRVWDDSDEEYDRLDYYTDSSNDYDSETSVIQRNSMTRDVEDDSENEEMEETVLRSSCVPTPESSSYEDECIECPWIEISPEQLPVLELPEGSTDLLIDGNYLLQTLEIYETCRWYYQSIRLSPFLFEDFCAAICAEAQTNLLAEMHIALLKLALKDDEDEQIILSVQDTNSSFNIMLQLLEPMTYAEVLRQYLESDPQRFPNAVLEAVGGNYPFVDVQKRLTVLSWLCDRFLQSSEYRNIVRNEGKKTVDELCRECGKPGDILLCDGCEASYHLPCTNLGDVPDGKWLCQVCELHKVRGVTDCELTDRSSRLPLRFNPLGYDRHGRRYWFLVRRIFVQDDADGSVQYYSTLPQLYALLNALCASHYEKHLAAVFMDLLAIIDEHMRITLQLTTDYGRSARTRNKTDLFLHADNVVRMGDILMKPLHSQLQESGDDRVVVKLDCTKHIEVSKYLLLCKAEELLGFKENCLTNTFWTAGMQTHEVITKKDAIEATFHSSLGTNNIVKFGFRLGEGDASARYINQFRTNEYAKSPIQRAKERDKKKYMCGRFSLMDEGEFSWTILKGRGISGTPNQIGKIIQDSLENFVQKIPLVLMHRLWKRDGCDNFKKGLSAPPTVDLLKDLLLKFECAIRRPVLHSVWWNALGHTRLIRITADDRERRQHYERKKKKQERELLAAEPDDDDVIWVKHLKVGAVLKRTLWRQNDEGYRVNGRGALGGWLWKSKTFHRTFVPIAEKPAIAGIIKSNTLANQKAIYLESVISRLYGWRTAEMECEERNWQTELLKNCYSPTCRTSRVPFYMISGNDSIHSCYSPTCRQALIQSMDRTTSGVVHARPLSSKCVQGNGQSNKVCLANKPFPLPTPFDYRVKRTGEQSILILPQRALKRLARQGGVNLNYFVPGFHRMAKSNSQVWDYPCQRPLFGNCWRYLLLRAPSYHSVALHLRILYACIRWADLYREPDEDMRVTVHLADHDEVRVITDHREYPPDGMHERYKLSIEIIPLDDNVELDDADEALRKRKPPKNKAINDTVKRDKIKMIERWVDGTELKPWEIADYWKTVENRKRNILSTEMASSRFSNLIIKRSELAQTNVREHSQSKPISKCEYNIRGNDDDDDEFIDVETLLDDSKAEVNSNFEPKQKIQRLSQSVSEQRQRGSSYQIEYRNPNVHYQFERVIRQPTELLGGDGTICRVMIYKNLPTQETSSTTVGSSRSSPVATSHLKTGSGEREPMRIQVPRRVLVASSSHSTSPPAAMGRKLLLIRRSDGTTQYLRPVTSGSGPRTYRPIRAIPAGSTVPSDVQSPTAGRIIRSVGPIRTVFSGDQLMGRSVQLPSRASSSANSLVGNHTSSVIRNTPMQQDIKRRVDDDRVVAEQNTGVSFSQMKERNRLAAESVVRSLGRPCGGAPSGSERALAGARPVVTVQPRQGLAAVVHSSLEHQTSGQTFGNGSRMANTGPYAVSRGRCRKVVRSLQTRIPGYRLPVSVHPGSERVRMSYPRGRALSFYGRIHSSRLDELADAASAYGQNFNVDRSQLRCIGTINMRSNLFIRVSDSTDLRVIKKILDELITEVCIMDAENGWHRRNVQLVFQKRQEERKRRELEQRTLKMERVAARRLEAELSGHIERFKKEVDKRRIKLEERAEAETGMIAPWRKARLKAEKDTHIHTESNTQLQSSAALPEPKNKFESLIHTVLNMASQEGCNEQSTSQLLSTDETATKLGSDFQKSVQQAEEQSTDEKTVPSTISLETGGSSITEQSQSAGSVKSEPQSLHNLPTVESQKVSRINKKNKEQQSHSLSIDNSSTWSRPKRGSLKSFPDIDVTKRHCKCNQPYDPKKFYVGCDLCYRWFHGKCVSITEKKSKKMTSWMCDDCHKEQKITEEELYCVCQTPYDDSRFYVGCDGCEGWFHPQCVGITKEEAEKAAEYLCPQCVRNKLTDRYSRDSLSPHTKLSNAQFELLWHVLNNLKEHRTSWPFREAVDPKEHPDYYTLIKKPMDLNIVQQKLEHREYHHLKEFTADITQIFENARIFNPKDSAIYQCADILEKQFRGRILEVKAAMETRLAEQTD